MKTWGDVVNEVRRAIAAQDWDGGALAVETLRREAEHQADPASLASAAFHAGLFHDARGALAESEAAFGEAVSWDERAHGPEHQAVAEALRSLAIVQQRRKRSDAAVRSYERAAGIYEKCGQPALAFEARRCAADTLRLGERWPEAFDAYQRAIDLAGNAEDLRSRTERVYATIGQSECMRCTREFGAAYSFACEATRQGAPPLDDALRTALGNAWTTLGFISRHAFSREEEAVLAYAIARDLTRHPQVRANALTAIAKSPIANLADAPVDGWVVATLGEKRPMASVYHPAFGARVATADAPYATGDRVEVVRESDGRFVITGRLKKLPRHD